VQRPRFLQWRWIALVSGILLITAVMITDSARPHWPVQLDIPIVTGVTLIMFGLISIVNNHG
jgi:hypothetical protein